MHAEYCSKYKRLRVDDTEHPIHPRTQRQTKHMSRTWARASLGHIAGAAAIGRPGETEVQSICCGAAISRSACVEIEWEMWWWTHFISQDRLTLTSICWSYWCRIFVAI